MNLDGLNDMQKRAVKKTEGPLLIIAGAGSGKTRVLTHRIAYLIEERGVQPYNILAITFTNKAAAEMKERVEKITPLGSQVWVSTFHSTCVRILRRYIDRLGYSTNFTIYDTDDQKSVIKDACKKLNIDTKMLKERTIMSAISRAKDELVTPDEMEMNAGGDYNARRIAGVYREYQKNLKLNNALDFDDLIFKTVELFSQDEEILHAYQERFKYIMVDEYQDTNTVQFKFISLLAAKHGNLCVVGDDDQSIYKFRGANIGNILSFENTFKDAKVIKLEQNYRSTKTILDAANGVIKNNIGRKDKTLWTANNEGEKINFCLYEDAYREAEGVVNSICEKVRDGWNYNEIAVLYRTNAQSRLLEERLIVRNVPYRIYGGVNFYQRREIKDILAYLKTVDNGMDAQAVRRIINVPKRGIGATTLERIQSFADINGCTFWDALCNAAEIPDIGRSLGKIESFVTLILGFRAKMEFMSIRELTETIIRDTKYIEYLSESETKEEVEVRQENIDEFINKIVSYEEGGAENDFDDSVELGGVQTSQTGGETFGTARDSSGVSVVRLETDGGMAGTSQVYLGAGGEFKPTLNGFLSEVALIADIDNLDQSGNQVMLMTLHSAKGLEFPMVYMTGLEDGLFPSYMTIVSDDPTDVEEERRLCYVGITRAQKELNISSAKQRMVHGETQMNKVSRFVKEIPQELLNVVNQATGYNKSKIAFGGETEPGEQSRFNFRASAKEALSRYGSGNTSAYSSYNTSRVRIQGKNGGSGSTYGMYGGGAGGVGYGAGGISGRGGAAGYSGATGYSGAAGYSGATGYAGRSKVTDYGSAHKAPTEQQKSIAKNVSMASPNKKAGFGKEFPMDIFDLKKKTQTSRTMDDSSYGVSGTSGGAGISGTSEALGYGVGDTVSHVKFGTGKVLAIENATKDYMVTVEFEEFGVKKMLAGFARLKKQ